MWCSTPSHVKASTRSRGLLHRAAGLGALCAALAAGLCSSAGASTPAPQPLSGGPAATAAIAGHAQLPGSRLQGQGLLRYLGLRVYQARLWTLPGFRAANALEQPLVLELEYLRKLNGAAIAERSLQEMRRAQAIDDAQAQRWLAEMQRLFPDVQAGDRLSGLLLPGQGARFWHNQRLLGQIDEPAFARLFFGIWLAPATSEPALRTALLGQDESRR